ncbi:HTTM domain-containing protein [Putridiphycobacter roseus]|uniref:HTTM domain-containing protein n=1 Tax=Putridiphycobacter roseus TaxID=2219161 RepID=A0A2W1MWR0_9FLAO|nr:HTTM domain-containing protein [Putridiphycobacter roseus]PZE16559.1 HTTM domain-containing protein [Putridiphycobacter roseus]
MHKINAFLFRPTSAAPLAVFRVIFGLMTLYSSFRFLSKGWVDTLYIQPKFHFTYYGFEWIKPFGATGMYLVFFLLIISALGILLGYRYRLSILLFFLCFTYIELLDKTTYLNHYYFVSLVSFLMLFLPANAYFSLDVYYKRVKEQREIPFWTIAILQFQLGAVYFFAGIAKLNYYWIVEAEPLNNWLKHQTDLPLIGNFMGYKATAYLFSWFGAAYDLCIPFLLLIKRTRKWAYLLVVIFHVLTAMMFPIGVFPFVMIGSTLIFFSANFHIRLITAFYHLIKKEPPLHQEAKPTIKSNSLITTFIMVYVAIQLILPFSYLMYPGNLFWTEQGFRFSWRVMLIEKVGYTEFSIKTKDSKGKLIVNNADYLTPFQEKMMATQPDMILEYAHYLKSIYKDTIIEENGKTFSIKEPIINANVQVSLFNKGSQTFIDPTIDLGSIKRGYQHKKWIKEYE